MGYAEHIEVPADLRYVAELRLLSLLFWPRSGVT